MNVNATEINFFEESSGSGLAGMEVHNPATSMSTSGADITDFSNLTLDTVGQLYAYYYSNTSVVLATRSAIISENVEIAVGVSGNLDDVYVCEAENFPERNNSGISRINVTIKAITREFLGGVASNYKLPKIMY